MFGRDAERREPQRHQRRAGAVRRKMAYIFEKSHQSVATAQAQPTVSRWRRVAAKPFSPSRARCRRRGVSLRTDAATLMLGSVLRRIEPYHGL